MSGTTDLDNPFVEWLESELRERNWSRDDLARAMGKDGTSGIGNLLTRTKNLGNDMARDIARALEIKQRVVFTIARIIDDEEMGDATQDKDIEEINRLLAKVDDPAERDRIRRIIRTVVREVVR